MKLVSDFGPDMFFRACFAFTCSFEGRNKHYKVDVMKNNLFRVPGNPRVFPNIVELVRVHQHEPINDNEVLGVPCPRTAFAYFNPGCSRPQEPDDRRGESSESNIQDTVKTHKFSQAYNFRKSLPNSFSQRQIFADSELPTNLHVHRA